MSYRPVNPQRHTGEIFVLESHPSDARILLSAGHDGLVIFWDMLAGVQLKSFLLEWEDGPVCVFDCKFSPDGLKCASVDSYGFLTIMGFGSDELYSKVLIVLRYAPRRRKQHVHVASHSSRHDDPVPKNTAVVHLVKGRMSALILLHTRNVTSFVCI